MGSCTEREEMFNLHPVGVRYICDFCNEGEMKVSTDQGDNMVTLGTTTMITHKCTKCNKKLHLPRSYPYVKFMNDDEYNKFISENNQERKGDNDDST